MSNSEPSSLRLIFPSMSMARLVIFFFVHPGERLHIRELMRRTGLPSASVQAELRRLTAIGALARTDEPGRSLYTANDAHPSWRAWAILIQACAAPSDVIREALAGLPEITCAFIFGSTARGTAAPESDVDVFIVAEQPARAATERVLAEVPILIGREIDVIGYDAEELSARLESGNAFVEDVLAAPRIWIRGGPQSIPVLEPA
ncbi:nucleotidyltransferase domain-containing protein [Longimicrobium terrae]|uniref:Putative nucleotidyltransferase n=1 Tax=Longimicrobium terrae TaxID=1639882 RepID=A0A841GY48_9BACT|nr:nucleotidyltransferase domain-containing protein [Longimicrobium terrae]MBB4636278.1 putative nucleotidyltransferase [Longimicrobium terrae]MBB6070674.1 putative nucleotidyltransferase [Longimicrobium terrae]NNC29656.1 hypothetical protein [Longimicrobium terrae]